MKVRHVTIKIEIFEFILINLLNVVLKNVNKYKIENKQNFINFRNF